MTELTCALCACSPLGACCRRSLAARHGEDPGKQGWACAACLMGRLLAIRLNERLQVGDRGTFTVLYEASGAEPRGGAYVVEAVLADGKRLQCIELVLRTDNMFLCLRVAAKHHHTHIAAV